MNESFEDMHEDKAARLLADVLEDIALHTIEDVDYPVETYVSPREIVRALRLRLAEARQPATVT